MNAALREAHNATTPPQPGHLAARGRLREASRGSTAISQDADVRSGANLDANVIFLGVPYHATPMAVQVAGVPTGSISIAGYAAVGALGAPMTLTDAQRRAHALSILDSWLAEEPSESAKQEYERLKQTLDVDRTSYRRRLPD